MKLASSTMLTFSFFLLRSFIFLYICLPTSLATSGILGNETDRLALLAFKDLISKDPLQVMSSWNESLHFCEWKGITCNLQHQRVSMLNLESQGLVGFISPSIGNLSFLRAINLQNNSFQGEIPQEIGRLFRLQVFNMSNNSFVGKIPVNFSHCTRLEILFLSYNKLVHNIPIEIGSLSKLSVLALHANNLTGGIPSSLGNLSSLNFLSLGLNNLQGSIPDSLGQLKNLKGLGLGPNNLSGMIPTGLYNLSSLEIFSITNNQLNGRLPPELGLNLPNLYWFTIAINQFFGPIPVSLFNASKLEKLGIGQNNFFGEVPTEVGNLKSLKRLSLYSNHLGSGKSNDLNFFNSLTNSTNLILLDIDDNHFGGKLPNSVANLSIQLERLYLGGNKIFGTIPSEISNLANLIILATEFNFLSGSIPKSIGMFQKLQRFNLQGNRFSGTIPSSIGNMSHLYYLKLSDNIFEGNIISDIGKCKFLQALDLSKNKFNGSIPKEVIGLSSQLVSISLAHNSLIGSLPLEVGNMRNLGVLDVSGNKLSGEIPSTLSSCSSLEFLHLQVNFFQGSIPSSLSSLKGIQELDLSMNNLSGKIPNDLEYLSSITNLNLSFNNLDGEVPIKGVFQNASAFSVVGNSKLCGGIPELQLHTCFIKKSKKHGTSLGFKVIIGIILSSVAAASFIVLCWRRKPISKSLSILFVGEWYKMISYHGLHKATEGFSSNNLIGVGSVGSVYKGVLHQDGILVAVKVLNLVERRASKSFITECQTLRKIRHRNLLKILTVCSSVDFKGNDFKALVFKFMPNGSLENWLHPSSNEQHLLRNLSLHQRLNISIDIAAALDYLHNHCPTPIVHCDIKPSNILLDDDMTAVVGDFGLAKFLIMNTSNSDKNDTSSISIKGTIGYIPPEYGAGAEVSTQGDVYSYGILLLEMFTGKRPTDNMFKDGLSLHDLSKMAMDERVMEIVDPCIVLLEEDHDGSNFDYENLICNAIEKMRKCLTSIIKIGVACSLESPGERMDIHDVLMELHMIKEVFLGVGIHGRKIITP